MTTTRIRAAAALTFAFIAASCGGDGGTGPTFSDSVSTADALDMASQGQGFTGSMLDFFSFQGPGLSAGVPSYVQSFASARGVAPRMGSSRFGPDLSRPTPLSAVAQLAASEGCTVTSHGFYDFNFSTPVDVNANGIPDDVGIRIDCLITDSISNPDTTVTATETIIITIKERMTDLFGYDEFVYEKIHQGDQFANFGQTEITETLHSSINADNANNAVEVHLVQSAKQDTSSVRQEIGQSWNANFDPTGSITLVDPLPNGSLTFTGREFAANTLGTNISFSLTTPTALAYHGGCGDPPFDSGVIHGALNNNSNSATFDVTFTGCGVAPTVTTGGTHDPAVVAVVR